MNVFGLISFASITVIFDITDTIDLFITLILLCHGYYQY